MVAPGFVDGFGGGCVFAGDSGTWEKKERLVRWG